jgi:hypothetical protein
MDKNTRQARTYCWHAHIKFLRICMKGFVMKFDLATLNLFTV